MRTRNFFLMSLFAFLFLMAAVSAGTFTVQPWTSDADSGISAGKIYTHTGKFQGTEGQPFYAGNGVWFEGDENNQGTDWVLKNIPHSFRAGHTTNVTGDGAALLTWFVYGDDDLNDIVHPILEVENLTPGQKYIMTCYAKGFGGLREVEITPSDDPNDATVVDQDLYGGSNGLLLKCKYIAPDNGKFSLTFDQVAAENVSWHHYAFSNEEVLPVYVEPDPAMGAFVDPKVTLNFEPILDEDVEISDRLFNLYWGTDPNVTNQVLGLTESSYTLDLDEATGYHWQIEVLDGEQLLYTTDPNMIGKTWTFTTKTLAPAQKALEYKMDESEGTTVSETIGGFDATGLNFDDPNDTSWTEGIVGNCLDFDGIDSYVDLGDTATLPFGEGQAFSISGYVKSTDSSGPLVTFRDSTPEGTMIMALTIGYDGVDSIDGMLRFISRSGPLLRMNGPVINDGGWNHFTLTRAIDGEITLYVNGTSQGSLNDSVVGYDVDLRSIGSEIRWQNDEHGGVAQRYLDGLIDEVVIWDGALKQSQIDEMVDIIPYRLNPTPAMNGSAPLDVTLNWAVPFDRVEGATYNVYLGTEPDMSSSIDGATGLSETEFPLTEPLEYNTQYYWQVEVVSGDEIVYTSPIWTFTTIDSTVGIFTAHSWTSDGDSGISSTKTYTHSGKFSAGGTDGDPFYAGNGFYFEGDTNYSGTNWTLTGTTGVFGPTNGANISGDSRNLALGFFYGDSDNIHPVLTLTGLTEGTKYITTFYAVGFGGPRDPDNIDVAPGRVVHITASDNPMSPTSLDQNIAGGSNGQMFKYTFTATSTEISFEFDADITGHSWHHYAFSNEEALLFELTPSPAPQTTVDTDVRLSWIPVPAEEAEGATYNLTVATNPEMTAIVSQQDGLVDTGFNITGLDGATQYYWKVDGLIDDQVVYSGPVWTFYTESTTPATVLTEWTMDEGTGTIIQEALGSGLDGTLINFDDPNVTGWDEGVVNTALNLDGVDDYVQLVDTTALTAPEGFAFSMSGYVKTTDSEGPIYSMRDPGILSVYVGFDGADNVPGHLRFISWIAGSLYRITGPRVDDGLWHHFAITRSSFGVIELFVDGISYGSVNDGAGEYFNQSTVFGSDTSWQSAGHGTVQQRYLAGQIDEFSIWSDELQPDQIAALVALIPNPADVDDSGSVDIDDLIIITAGWISDDPQADINGSGTVDMEDFGIVSENWD